MSEESKPTIEARAAMKTLPYEPVCPVQDVGQMQCIGLTIREYMAGQALVGLLIRGAKADAAGAEAVKVADAVINALNGEGK